MRIRESVRLIGTRCRKGRRKRERGLSVVYREEGGREERYMVCGGGVGGVDGGGEVYTGRRVSSFFVSSKMKKPSFGGMSSWFCEPFVFFFVAIRCCSVPFPNNAPWPFTFITDICDVVSARARPPPPHHIHCPDHSPITPPIHHHRHEDDDDAPPGQPALGPTVARPCFIQVRPPSSSSQTPRGATFS